MSSFWIDTTNNGGHFSKLNKDINIDVCIIGAGLFGLTTAYYLSKSGKKVAVLEKEDSVATKTSGNTTGKITSQHDLFYNYLINDFGVEFAKNYLEANEQAIQNVKNIIDENNIDCDFEWQDSYIYTCKNDEVDKIRNEVNSVNSLGFNANFVTTTPLPIKIKGAIKFEHQAQFHPRKYMLGLCSCIINKSGEIYTNSDVTDISKDSKNSGYVVSTSNAHVYAKHVVIATRYPFISFPGFYFTKMYQSTSYALAVDTKCDLFNRNVYKCFFSFLFF